MNEQCRGSTSSPALDDCESLVSVSPVDTADSRGTVTVYVTKCHCHCHFHCHSSTISVTGVSVPVSPVDTVDSLSTDGSSSNAAAAAAGGGGVSDVEDSQLSDAAVSPLSYNAAAQHADVCSWRCSKPRRHADLYNHAAADLPQQQELRQASSFDGGEMATIRKLELELMAGDLSRQMWSMQQLMRLLSCETRQPPSASSSSCCCCCAVTAQL